MQALSRLELTSPHSNPAGHTVQLAWPPTENVPRSHAVLVSVVEYGHAYPGAHAVHRCCAPCEYDPGAHSIASSLPVKGQYEPLGHCEQPVPFLFTVNPRLQKAHSVTDPAAAHVIAAHATGANQVTAQYVAAGHSAQLVAFPSEYVPAAHLRFSKHHHQQQLSSTHKSVDGLQTFRTKGNSCSNKCQALR